MSSMFVDVAAAKMESWRSPTCLPSQANKMQSWVEASSDDGQNIAAAPFAHRPGSCGVYNRPSLRGWAGTFVPATTIAFPPIVTHIREQNSSDIIMKFSTAFAALLSVFSAISPSIASDNENLAICASLLPNLRSQKKDELNKCFIEECSEKADDVDKAIKCQNECVTDSELGGRKRNSMGPNGAGSLLSCGAGCAKDTEKIYKEELKDITKDIKKGCGCDKKDDKCRKACKNEEEEANKDAEEKANEKYQKCTVKCFDQSESSLEVF
eukprot:scaffold7071_cov42-Cyclotella_meneghiniana.AAC.3